MNEKQTLQIEEVVTQLEGLNEQLKQEKVDLTPEVEAYIDEKVRRVHGMLQRKEDIFAKDLEFIQFVLDWIEMNPDLRDQFPKIDEMMKNPDFLKLKKNAQFREISISQWYELLTIAKFIDLGPIEIEAHFSFGNGKINCNSHLTIAPVETNVKFKESEILIGPLKKLPDEMTFTTHIQLSNIEDLVEIPEATVFKGTTYITSCNNIEVLDCDFRDVVALYILESKKLTRLKSRIKKGGLLEIQDCPKLHKISEDNDLGLLTLLDVSKELKEQAQRLYDEEKIGKLHFPDDNES